MKRLLAVLLILVQCLFLVPMQAVAEETTTVTVHYKEVEGNDKDWNLWLWPAGGEGSAYDFTGEDNFGKVVTITLPGNHNEVGFIVRTESWEKDTPNDRFIKQFDSGVAEIWILGGQEEFYYENPEGPDFIVDESVQLEISYHNFNESYDDLSALVYFPGEEGQTVNLSQSSEFGVQTTLQLNDTMGKTKIVVDIIKSGVVLETYDVKKIKDGKASVYFVENTDRTYYSLDDAVYKPEVVSAKLSDTSHILLESNIPFKVETDTIKIWVNGEEKSLTSVEWHYDDEKLTTTSVLTLEEAVAYTDVIELELPKFETARVQLGDVYDTLEFNSQYNYEGELGPIYSESDTIFRVWAPTASDIKLAFFDDYKSESTTEYDMTRTEKGVWEVTVDGDLHNQLYAYNVKLVSAYEYVVDPYAKGVSVNGQKSAVIDLERTNPVKWDMDYATNFTAPTDAIMYEIHVRDLSMHSQSGIENKGLYLGFTEKGTTTNNGFSTGLDYIKELGVTHVQLMPIYDYGSIDETKDDYSFNWGYDPVNYNALEGSYSSDPFTPDVRINEFKQAVQALHNEGLKVTMDVVYNHVFSLNAMAFEKLVPGYYFRKEGDNYANGSGCGNETASERYMMQKFMVESVTYLADEYNLDGFRFDLMGLHDVETMNAIRTSLNDIDPSITIIGEGWNMGIVLDESLKANQNQAHLMTGIAHFNDTIRDGLKGSVFDGLDQGFVNGKLDMENTVFSGIVGGVYYNDLKTWGDIEPNQSVTYVEAHDNNTLFDKLKISNPEADPAEIKQMHLLADSIVLTSQGVTFIHAGQEFLRTKLGDENSYKSSDIINRLDWLRREKNNDVVEYFKTLIEIRKTHEAFRMPTKEVIQESITPLELEDGVIAYQIKYSNDEWANIVVVFNANSDAQNISLPNEGEWTVVAESGRADIEGLRTTNDNIITINGIDSIVMYQSGDLTSGTDAETSDDNSFNYIYLLLVGAVAIMGLVVVRKRK